MYYNKEKYEALIMESPVFSLDKVEETSAYKRETYRLIEYLYCYLMAVNETAFEPYGSEIAETAIRCIANYDMSKGVFLHYFNAAWKKEYSHIMGNKLIDDKFHGIKITEEDRRNIRKYIRLAHKNQSNITDEELRIRISDAMHLPLEKVRLVAQMNDLRVTGDKVRNSDGEEFSLWDQISDETSFEDYCEEADSFEDLLNTIEAVFVTLQERQKPIVSDMITSRIWSLLSPQHNQVFSFVSHEVIDECVKCGHAPSQRAIADKYDRDEASISRTVKEFVKKLRSYLREVQKWD